MQGDRLSRQFASGLIRILVVDDHGIVRDGVCAILNGEPSMTVVATAGSGVDALRVAGQLRPDVIIMEMLLPDCSGFDAAIPILASLPASHLVVLSEWHTSQHLYRAR